MKIPKIPTIKEIQEYFLQLPVTIQLIAWAKENSLPGFFKVPIFDVVVFLYNESRRDDLFTRANSMAFSFFLSLFPSLISLFTLLPYVRQYLLTFLPDNGQNFDDILRSQILEIVPGNVGNEIFTFIDDLTTNPRVGLLSFGFVLALYFASNGMMAMMKGFEKSYMKTFKKRTTLRKQMIAVFLTFQFGVLLIASVILIIVGNLIITFIADYVRLGILARWSLFMIRWVVIVFLFYSVISTIYRYGVALKQKFGTFSPGATLATTLSILSSILFSFYVDNFGRYNELYGGFGTVIVTMLWIQINSLVLLIGFELNASIAINRDLKEERMETM